MENNLIDNELREKVINIRIAVLEGLIEGFSKNKDLYNNSVVRSFPSAYFESGNKKFVGEMKNTIDKCYKSYLNVASEYLKKLSVGILENPSSIEIWKEDPIKWLNAEIQLLEILKKVIIGDKPCQES